MQPKRLAIIGAGPAGLEAALYAIKLGYQVTVFEKNKNYSQSILQRSNQALFASWKMILSPLGIKVVKFENPAWHIPEIEGFPDFFSYVSAYLQPIAESKVLKEVIKYGKRVVTVGREDIGKTDLIGDRGRNDHPFRLLVEDESGNEQFWTSDIVIDASGVHDFPNALGQGGIYALNERAIAHEIPYVAQIDGKWINTHCANKKILLVGEQLEGIETARHIISLMKKAPQTQLIWSISADRDTDRKSVV